MNPRKIVTYSGFFPLLNSSVIQIYKLECFSRSVVSDFLQPIDVAFQAPLSMEFSKQEYWSGLPFPSPGNLLNPGIEPRSPALQAYSLPSLSYQGSPQIRVTMINNLTITKVAKKEEGSIYLRKMGKGENTLVYC